MEAKNERFITAHGGYRKLFSYQKAVIVYDATVYFCNRFISKRDRTHDQMIQGARSGKQNIIEGSQASGTSRKAEIKLTDVARSSLEELLEDYRDFLRSHGLKEWSKNHPYAKRLRELNRTPGADYKTFRRGIEHPDPEICTNVIMGLVKVTNYLLDRQLDHLERAFINKGGMSERMRRVRYEIRSKSKRCRE